MQVKIIHNRIFLHFLYWFSYVLFFGMIYGKYGNDYGWYLLESLCMLPFIMAATYLTIYLYLPFYLKRKRMFRSVLLMLATLFSATLGERVVIRLLNSLPISFDQMFNVSFLYLLLETNFMVGGAIAIKLIKKWFEQQNQNHEIEKRQLQSELKLLKAQLQPHFLFNTLNNLYALSLEKSSKISECIARISELLRSVLYECDEAETDLAKEIMLIENFIELEKMRYGDRLNIELNINGKVKGHRIAPMMLYIFVENCFKHGSSIDPGNPWINIKISTNDNCISFVAQNSKFNDIDNIQLPNPKNRRNGIGLKNAKKRLELLYSNRYSLNFAEDMDKYEVKLEIKH